MRIGIDMDDTICKTTEIVHDRVEKYAKSENLDPLDVMNDETKRLAFFNIYLEDIYRNVEEKQSAREVIHRLREKGHEIFIVTARGNNFVPTVTNVREIIETWFKEHDIEVDAFILDASLNGKSNACRDNKIDLMIEDNPYNYKMISAAGIPCLLFDDHGKYEMKDHYVTTWFDIERYIERNF